MAKKYKTYSPEFKAKVVKEILRGEKTVPELSSEYGIPSRTLQYWHEQFLNGVDAVFQRGKEEKDIRKSLPKKKKKLKMLTKK